MERVMLQFCEFVLFLTARKHASQHVEYEVQVRLPGLGAGGAPSNANSPRSVNVDLQGQVMEESMQ